MDANEIGLLSDVENSHWWYVERRRKLENWARENLLPGSKVLDVGSAAGKQVELLTKLGFEAEGLEYSKIGFEIQNEKGLKVTRGSATDLPWDDCTFDAVICMDVLEHIEDDQQAANELLRVLKDGGKFLISVPNDPKLWSAHDESVGHYRRYTTKSIRSLLEKEDARISGLDNWNIVLKPALKVMRKFSKGSDLKKPSGLENFFCKLLIRIEDLLPISVFPGVSLWCYGQKRLTP